MATDKTTAKRTNYPADFKLKVLEDYNTEGAIASEVAAKHGVHDVSAIYRWQSSQDAIRAAAKKILKQRGPKIDTRLAASNGASNGNGHEEPKQAKTPLQITGLTPLIRELVNIEISRLLPEMVEARLKAGFTVKPS